MTGRTGAGRRRSAGRGGRSGAALVPALAVVPVLAVVAVAVTPAAALPSAAPTSATTAPTTPPTTAGATPTAASTTAATGTPSTTAPPEPTPAAPGLTVTSVTPLEFVPDGQVTIRGVIGTGDEPLGDARLEVLRTVERLDTRSAVDLWSGGTGEDRLVEVASVALGPVPVGGALDVAATIASDALQLRSTLSSAGPYGMVVRLRDAASPGDPPVSEDRGFIVWSPDLVDDPLLLSTVVDFPSPVPDARTGLVDPERLEAAAGSGGGLRRALDAAAVLPGAWSLDPLLTASAEEADAGPATRRWLADLRDAGGSREVLQQEWGTPELDLLAASGRAPELGRLLDEAATGATAGPGRDPTVPGGPTRTDVAVVPGAVSAQGLAVAAAAGKQVVVPDTTVPLVDGSLPFTPDLRTSSPTSAGPVSLLVVDSAMSEALTAAVGGDALAGTRLMADLAATALQRPSDRRVLGLLVDDLDRARPDAAREVATTLAATPWAGRADVAAWIATDPDPQPREAPPDLTPARSATVSAEVDELLAALTTLESLEDAVATPTGPDPSHRLRTASAVADDLPLVREVSASLRDTAARWVQGVRIVQGSTVTLAADEAALPVTLVNDLDTDVQLVLQARSRSPRLRVLDTAIPVDLPAGARTRVDLPVRAVSNGPASVSLRLLTPDTTPWGPPVETDVRVATVAEAGVLGVAAALAGSVFVVGTWRSVRRRRRQRATRDAGALG